MDANPGEDWIRELALEDGDPPAGGKAAALVADRGNSYLLPDNVGVLNEIAENCG